MQLHYLRTASTPTARSVTILIQVPANDPALLALVCSL